LQRAHAAQRDAQQPDPPITRGERRTDDFGLQFVGDAAIEIEFDIRAGCGDVDGETMPCAAKSAASMPAPGNMTRSARAAMPAPGAG
jgi:hypothetical protein